jgi:hypothetical protein
MNAKTAKTTDYIFCSDCNEFVDFWKYNHNIKDAGHDDCQWRYVTKEELKECIEVCEEYGCFEEQFIGPTLVILGPEDNLGNVIQAS